MNNQPVRSVDVALTNDSDVLQIHVVPGFQIRLNKENKSFELQQCN